MTGLDLFHNFFSPDNELIIFDVGAHIGDSVQEFVTLFPKSHVFAFEPDKVNFTRFSTRFRGNPRVRVFNVAVGDKDGRVILHKNNYDATHSLLPFNSDEINRWADANDFHETGIEEVDQIALDTFCDTHAIAKIDILKLDTQGGEMMAFEGGQKKLSYQAIGAIFCEVEFRQLYKSQPLFWDITEYLISHGYHFLNFVSPKVSEMGVLSWADAIFINDRLWQGVAARHSAGKLIA